MPGATDSHAPSIGTGPRVKIVGVRRIWGILRTTSTPAISATLKKLTTCGDNLTVKRRSKTVAGGHERWWFNIRGEEEVVLRLLCSCKKLENCMHLAEQTHYTPNEQKTVIDLALISSSDFL